MGHQVGEIFSNTNLAQRPIIVKSLFHIRHTYLLLDKMFVIYNRDLYTVYVIHSYFFSLNPSESQF